MSEIHVGEITNGQCSDTGNIMLRFYLLVNINIYVLQVCFDVRQLVGEYFNIVRLSWLLVLWKLF